MRFGDRVLGELGKRDRTSTWLADRARLNRNTVYSVCAGHNRPTLRTALRMADALGVDIGELCKGVDR